jgi:hypothetical protein
MSHDRARMTGADAKIIARYSSSICCEFAFVGTSSGYLTSRATLHHRAATKRSRQLLRERDFSRNARDLASGFLGAPRSLEIARGFTAN